MVDYGHKMSISQFIEDCENKCLMDDDGFGILCNNNLEESSHIEVLPSDYFNGTIDFSKYDYIIWYNK